MIIFRQNNKREFLYLTNSKENGKVWMNLSTHRHTRFKLEDLQKGIIYQTDHFDHLAYIKDYLRETLDSGWITREGQFWGCRCTDHENVLNTFFLMDRNDAERQGWVHVSRDAWFFTADFYDPNLRINDAQEQALIDIGRDPDDPLIRKADLGFGNVFPNGYPFASLPGGIVRRYKPGSPAPKPSGP